MKREDWQRVEELYYGALECDPDERAAYLARACGEDPELRREVESLLRADSEGAGFLERVRAEAATLEAPGARARTATRRAAPGKPIFTWGHLDVLQQVGEGGFGEVYRA